MPNINVSILFTKSLKNQGMAYIFGILDIGGLPVGFQIIGNYFDEARPLNVAHRYQQAHEAFAG